MLSITKFNSINEFYYCYKLFRYAITKLPNAFFSSSVEEKNEKNDDDEDSN